MDIALELILATLWLWALYGLLSAAFALSFRVGGFFDLSVGASFLVGGYGSWLVAKIAPPLLAVVGGVCLATLVAISLGRWLVAPLAVRLPPLALFVATLAVLYIAQAVAAVCFGESALVLWSGPARSYDLGAVNITTVQLTFGIATAVLLFGLIFWLQISRWGRFARAIADDRVLATLLVIPVQGTILRCYGISGALAGFAGAFFVADRAIDPSQGLTVLLAAMVGAVLGGKSIGGAILGALVLATLETGLGFLLQGNWKTTVAFGVLLTVLIARPDGVTQIVRRRI